MSDRVNGGRYPGCEYEYAKIPGVSGIFAPKKEQGRTEYDIPSDKQRHGRNISSDCSIDGY